MGSEMCIRDSWVCLGVCEIPLNRNTVDGLDTSIASTRLEDGEFIAEISNPVEGLSAGKYIKAGNRLLIITRILSTRNFVYNPQLSLDSGVILTEAKTVRVRLKADITISSPRIPDWYGPWNIEWVEVP